MFLYHLKSIVVLSFNRKRYSTCDHFFIKLMGLEDCLFGQIGSINERIISLYYHVSGGLISLKMVPNWLKEAYLPKLISY